jgi:glycosyltransferase involved in cell wall biosynthesis
LLRVFKALKEKHKALKLVILAEGELKDYLVGLSEELGLKTYVWDRDKLSERFDVYFLGFQKNPFKFIARSKLFVFPSLGRSYSEKAKQRAEDFRIEKIVQEWKEVLG